MNIDEAIESVIELVDFYSDNDLEEPIKIILKEREYLLKAFANLAIESVKREKELARLEGEIIFLQKHSNVQST